jgi:hypothetical protein
MDILDDDLLELWASLNNNNVNYIMIGGFATNIHGFNRFTADADLWLEDSNQNRVSFRKTLKEIGIGDFPMIQTMQFVPGFTSFRLTRGIELDVMTNVKGLEEYSFKYCLEMATIATIENIAVPFLHINQLILSKKATNRPKDQIDIIELEKIKKLRELK